MTSIVEALIIIACGALSLAYTVVGGRTLQVASAVCAILALVVGIVLAIHAGL